MTCRCGPVPGLRRLESGITNRESEIYTMFTFQQALNVVKTKVTPANVKVGTEVVPLGEACGRVLAEDVLADRDYPPFPRSTRDGFAVRAEDLLSTPVELHSRGEIRAGEHFSGVIGTGECVSIMTGAPLPDGADAVVMVEYTDSAGDSAKVLRAVRTGENVVPQGSEARHGTVVLTRGRRVGAAEVGLLATVGKARVAVYVRPVVAIVPTGDEVIPVEQAPEWFQTRNSNAVALSAQVTSAGGIARCLEVAPDRPEALRRLIGEGLESDLLLLTGGVSAGKYDLVEQILSELGAEFYFQSVALRPGKPLVFGRVGGKFFFGLPGNPISTYVTFAMFARPALAVLQGAGFEPPLFLPVRLGKPVARRTGLTMFLPARLERTSGDLVASPVTWQGSGDLVGVSAADCFIVLPPEQTALAAGDWVDMVLKAP